MDRRLVRAVTVGKTDIGCVNEQFWNRVESIREEKDINPKVLSEASFKHRNAYGAALKNFSPPGIDFVDGIARALDVNIHYLATGFGPRGPYIPADVPVPADPEGVIRVAREQARSLRIHANSISLVLRQNPDPRLGVAGIVELFRRAEKMLSVRADKVETKRKAAPVPRRSRR